MKRNNWVGTWEKTKREFCRRPCKKNLQLEKMYYFCAR
jgi:hypothetical protein